MFVASVCFGIALIADEPEFGGIVGGAMIILGAVAAGGIFGISIVIATVSGRTQAARQSKEVETADKSAHRTAIER